MAAPIYIMLGKSGNLMISRLSGQLYFSRCLCSNKLTSSLLSNADKKDKKLFKKTNRPKEILFQKLKDKQKQRKVINEMKEEMLSSSIGSNISRSRNSGDKSDANNLDLLNRNSRLVVRPPVVTIMGHIDHGKTTLLDSMRKTTVASSEAGGITQHIGAFVVTLSSGEKITFLDTPGHTAFRTIRERGASVTDIVILVVAADDGVMEQTLESYRYAAKAQVPVIVAINKCDKSNADVEYTKNSLIGNGIVIEEYGGDIQAVEISALKGTNLNSLIEAITTLSEILQLRADPNADIKGCILESKKDITNGLVATALIEQGTLKIGNFLTSGTSLAKVRAMFNDQGQPVTQVDPGIPVEIIGWRDMPLAGDTIIQAKTEKEAKARVKKLLDRKKKIKIIEENSIIQNLREKQKLENLENKIKRLQMNRSEKLADKHMELINIQKENSKKDSFPKLELVIKGDVIGSMEAILETLSSYTSKKCVLNILHWGIGTVTKNDVQLSSSFSGIIYTFNLEVDSSMINYAESLEVPIRNHKVIYAMIDDIKDDLEAKLPPIEELNVTGEARVLKNFVLNEGKKRELNAAGCIIENGQLNKNMLCQVFRNNSILFDGSIASLYHFQQSVNSVVKGKECGLIVEDKDLKFEMGDVIKCYEMKSVPNNIDWKPFK